MVDSFCGNCQVTESLSHWILNFLNLRNMGLVDGEVIRDLVRSLPDQPFQVTSIHDCFRVHPNQGNDLRRQYNRILTEIAAPDTLAFIVSQVTGTRIQGARAGRRIMLFVESLC
jgi:hypothetical protein